MNNNIYSNPKLGHIRPFNPVVTDSRTVARLKHFGCFDGLRGTGIEMTLDEALSASHQGQCDADVEALLNQPHIKAQFDALDADTIRQGLKEYGAWDADELADEEANRQRALWSAACDIRESYKHAE